MRISFSIKNISASEGESGYSSRSNSLTPPSSPPLRFGSHDQFRKFASGAGGGMSQIKKSPEVGMFHRDRRDQWRDKVSVRFHTDQLGLLFIFAEKSLSKLLTLHYLT